MNDNNANPSWDTGDGKRLLVPDDIAASAIEVLFGKGNVLMPMPPSDMAVHPYEFLDDDSRHDYELIETCPNSLPNLTKDAQLGWAKNVCSNAKTRLLREFRPALLVRILLSE